MKRFAAALGALAFVLGATAPAIAITLPPTQPGVYVYDLARIWTPETISSANATIAAIRQRTQAEIAVVSWPSGLSDVSTDLAQSDALTIMNAWGVGRAGVDDGLVVLFDLDTTLQHGQIYLYTGSGFRAMYLADDEAAAIVNDTMLPKAKDGDLDAALLDGLARIDHVVQPGGNPDRAGQALIHTLVAAAMEGGALIVLVLFARTWWLRGRDARVPTIDDSVLLPAPPPELTPALAAVLRKDEVDNEAFTAALVDLGHRNLVTFSEHSQLLGGHKVDLVIPSSDTSDAAVADARKRPLGTAEQSLADDIQAQSIGGVISASQLRAGTGRKLFDAFKTSLGKAALASGWFRDDPTKLTSVWLGVGIVVVVVAAGVFFLFGIDQSSDSSRLLRPGAEYLGAPILIGVLIGAAIIMAQRWLVARTESGAQTLAMALAYRNTLRYEIGQSATIDQAVVRTTSRLPWITTPDELTVWAVALGLKSEIDQLIKQTFQANPQGGWAPIWFVGSGGFASVGDMGSMLSSISTTSASSSGGGYGGGGGGGGGGAGGGF
ncbi:MAG TPA: TPM domain-containing protein [Candidatus Limnocylindrales bacterium]|nr:TPM domain-containing protein [Candidatus Limnocylindrales bacterium]